MNLPSQLTKKSFLFLFLLFTTILNVTAQQSPVRGGLTKSCKQDSDCDSLTKSYNLISLASLGAYACAENKCIYVVKAGEICGYAEDCAAYHQLIRYNYTDQSVLSEICSSQYCTLESNCDGAWTLDSVPPKPDTYPTKCCGGINPTKLQCPVKGINNIDVCAAGFTCTNGNCETAEQHYQTWIGVVLVLLGGSLLNFGLNLQKFSLNRHDRRLKERAQAEELQNKIQIATPRSSPSSPVAVMKTLAEVDESNNTAADALPVTQKDILSNQAHLGKEISNPASTASTMVQGTEFRAGSPPMGSGTLEHKKVNRTLSHASVAHSITQTIGHGAVTLRDKVGSFIRFWRKSVLSPLYLLGLIIYIFASFLNFVALQFAPQSLVGPLGSVSLIVNIILAPIMNKEKLGKTDFIGIFMIIGGCVIVVFFAGIVQHDYRLCVLFMLFSQPQTIVFLTVIIGLIAVMFGYIKIVEKNLEKVVMEVSPADAELSSLDGDGRMIHTFEGETRNTNESISPLRRSQSMRRTLSKVATSPVKKLRQCKLFELDHSIFDPVVPTLKHPIRRQSKHFRFLLPLAYAGLGSLMATLTTLFAKTLINLLSVSIFQGENQFNSWLSWVILLFVGFTAFSQVYWIMLGLRRYDALLQVPVFYVIWTVFDIIGGGVYFNEFRDFTPLKYGMFSLGVLVIFAGVAVLARRMAIHH